VSHIPSVHPHVRAIDPTATARRDDWSLDEMAAGFSDVVHIHFGFEHLDAHSIRRFVAEAHERHIRVVYTVHDLDNPHMIEQGPHHERVAALVDTADRLLTLTPSAAIQVEERWGRRPCVIEHPPLTGPIADPPMRSGALVWLGALRPNTDLAAVARCLKDSMTTCRVVVRHEAWNRAPQVIRTIVEDAVESGPHVLEVVFRPDDDDLARLMASARVLFLPYAWGTHSGLAEMARNVGTLVLTTPSQTRTDQGAIACEPNDFHSVLDRFSQSNCPPRILSETEYRSRLDRIRGSHLTAWDSVRAGDGVRPALAG